MATYRVTDDNGREINRGDTVTNFRDETGTFERVTRGVEYNGTAKVVVSSREYYSTVWNLTVATVEE